MISPARHENAASSMGSSADLPCGWGLGLVLFSSRLLGSLSFFMLAKCPKEIRFPLKGRSFNKCADDPASSYSVHAYDERARHSRYSSWSGSLTTGGSRSSSSSSSSPSSSSSSLGSRGGILLPMTSRRSQSTDQVGTLSKIGRIMSAPVGYRDTDARMLLCESAVGQAWSARWPHTNSTSVRSLASGPS